MNKVLSSVHTQKPLGRTSVTFLHNYTSEVQQYGNVLLGCLWFILSTETHSNLQAFPPSLSDAFSSVWVLLVLNNLFHFRQHLDWDHSLQKTHNRWGYHHQHCSSSINGTSCTSNITLQPRAFMATRSVNWNSEVYIPLSSQYNICMFAKLVHFILSNVNTLVIVQKLFG